MGPYSERRQLERAWAVARLLEQDDLSPWAKKYWSKVLKELATNEGIYNYRVKTVYTEMRNRQTRNWL